MTGKPEPAERPTLPAAGGSFIRQPDGSLLRSDPAEGGAADRRPSDFSDAHAEGLRAKRAVRPVSANPKED